MGADLLHFIHTQLRCPSVTNVRTGTRYDVSGLEYVEFDGVRRAILGEAPVDEIMPEVFFQQFSNTATVIAIESQPGQYNQTEDWAQQCILLETGKSSKVRTAECIVVEGNLPEDVLGSLKQYLINKNENREASQDRPRTLEEPLFDPDDVKVLDGFTVANDAELKALAGKDGYKLAMTIADMHKVQEYFLGKGRNPTVTELKVIDTYWSDHCRHTTFTTALQNFFIDGQFVGDGNDKSDADAMMRSSMQRCIQGALKEYLQDRKEVLGDDAIDSPPNLMELATLSMKRLKTKGKLDDMENSKENNAASIIVPVRFEDGHTEQWLYMFKNETHNHPTEIEPYGGAATCVGGAIRDPLSGRAYVFMGMRLSGSGDPRIPLSDTLPGKLSQRRITTGAAAGYSGYGNQIGVPTQKVVEVYHSGFVAKRLECGFVGGAVPLENVCREDPEDGDVVILLGGRTGRDGMGGATGSSIGLSRTSIDECGVEVQKGNAPGERMIQRLFNNPKVSKLIKRCNDFGAGGVSVAIGELSDGLDVDLDRVPLKYKGLDGTEIAISESQERMAVVVSRKNLKKFLKLAEAENLEATQVAIVTNKDALTMKWRGNTICDLDRNFLNGGWAPRTANVDMPLPADIASFFTRLPEGIDADAPLAQQWIQNLGRLNVCSKRGIQQRFDSTVGANTVKNPYGGRHQVSPSEAALVKFPASGATTAVASSIGFDPDLSAESPFHGAIYAVVDAIARIVATGGKRKDVRLTMQNFFEKLGDDAKRWGKPMLAQLGKYLAEKMLGVASIGGKDSMSGSFTDETTGNRIDVPPTLVAFAIATMQSKRAIHSEFQQRFSTIVHLRAPRDVSSVPDWKNLRDMWKRVHKQAKKGNILSAHAVHSGGLAAALTEMSIGNGVGADISHNPADPSDWFSPEYGSIVVEIPDGADPAALFEGLPYSRIGRTGANSRLRIMDADQTCFDRADLVEAYESPLDPVFPRTQAASGDGVDVSKEPFTMRAARSSDIKRIVHPKVGVLVLPGTNCEYETVDAFTAAGAKKIEVPVFVNLTRAKIEESVGRFADVIDRSQIIALPGGFSAGDEPKGSGKFGAAVLRSPRIADAMHRLRDRGGLVLGICNGFQTLIKSGLLTGNIRMLEEDDATLTHNDCGHFLSTNVRHRVTSVLSPWMSQFVTGDVADFPIAHGEGKLIQAQRDVWQKGQVPFQYVGNPNGSEASIAALTDDTGRIFGMMAHPERALSGLSINVPTERKGMRIFESGIAYFQ